MLACQKASAIEIARAEQEYMRNIRRELHSLPELSLHERRTSQRIAEELDTIGVPYVRVGEFGLVATIEGTRKDRVVALRADMDALPIQEDNPHLDYCSQTAGVMHACGHDGHVAMLLGAARILEQLKSQLQGTVKLCFQQAEEVGKGTQEILRELAGFPVETVFGIHLWSEIETGKISVEAGPRMAAGKGINITVRGTGTHGAYPNRGVDPVIASAAILLNCSALVSREIDAAEPVVLTFGQIHAGEAGNVIPDTVRISGSLRTTSIETEDFLMEAVERVVQNTAAAYRAKAEVSWPGGVPVVANDSTCSEVARVAVHNLGLQDQLTSFRTMMASENYADFLAVYPGVFALIGVRNEALGACYPHHHPKFNIDEEPLATGAALHAQYALDYFSSVNVGAKQ
ncbi:amidohydrolase [Brucella pituitosa]|uniref:amidohydrolase n=1 Tax=Brucella pituitosa TaxID=571256 RepID=UPI003F4AD3B6